MRSCSSGTKAARAAPSAWTKSFGHAWPSAWITRRAISSTRRLARRSPGVSRKTSHGNAIFYLATSPRFFPEVAQRLGQAGLLDEFAGGFRRVVVEKPFGTDLASAEALNTRLLKVMGERQIYRIDHYLGKETVQNILVSRFSNGLFESFWNNHYIDHVQITAAETVGVETRGAFYDSTGALRDMVPNHLFQLLAMVAMEPPAAFGADAVRGEKAKVVGAIRPWSAKMALKNSVRGQYSAGKQGRKQLPGYRQEPNVAPDSQTETYVALKVMIDNWRWAGVPFYLRTGKRMQRARHRNCHLLQARAVCAVPRVGAGAAQAQLPENPDSAQRRHVVRPAGQTARAGAGDGECGAGLCL